MFKKKFKVRIKRMAFNSEYYVQYAHYRFFPIWHSLCWWFDQGHPGGTECWTSGIYDIEEAEKLAGTLGSIGDVRSYYVPFEEEERKWHRDEKKHWQEKAPYTVKNIK